ncbi:MAG: DUF4124 domain-containing protein, partial [Pseudomonadota bacterium]
LLPLLLCSAPPLQAELYRWTDEHGKVHYSDKIPARHQHRGHSQLNTQGVVIDKVASSISPAQQQLRIQREKLQRRQQAFQQRQHNDDQALLERYDSVDDIVMTRDGKIIRIEHSAGILQSQAENDRLKLANLQQRIDAIQAKGETVPVEMIEKLVALRRHTKQEEAKIAKVEGKIEQLRRQFEQDLQRYRHLKQPDRYPPPTLEQQSGPIEGVVTCSPGDACKSLWKLAVAYVNKHSDTPVTLQTDELVTTEEAMLDQHISLILALIGDATAESASIFLEVRCRASARREPCSSERATRISRGFRPALLSASPRAD